MWSIVPAGVLAAEIKRFNKVRALSGIRHDTGQDLATAADLIYIYNIIPLKRFTPENPEKALKNALL